MLAADRRARALQVPATPEARTAAAAVAAELLRDVRLARLQRSLALIAGLTSGASGLEVGYMHYRASYGHRIMWTPILMSQLLAVTGVWGALSPRVARTALPLVGWVTLADCGVGAFFHWRGTSRKPGGWRLIVPNVPMGPPPMAPMLFGLSAYMGIVASKMKPETALSGAPRLEAPTPDEGRLRRHVALAAGLGALGSGIEALYSHYKNGFHYKAQWTPVLLGPMLAGVALVSRSQAFPRPRTQRLLAAVSGLAMLDAAVGSFYHARGVLRRPGGRRHLLYNILYGPPLLAPGLFAASGLLGLLASLMRPRRQG